METRQIRVIGRVQGVGYRYALRDEALRLGIAGWVRNRADGSVEALLQGDAAALARLITWARRGPRLAKVDNVREEPPLAEHERHYHGFEIWPSG
jgi:acylphosphatase